VFHDVQPDLRRLTVASSPTGLQVSADGVTGAAPVSGDAIVNVSRSLSTTGPQTMGGTTYYFQSWSDGGAKAHNVFMPAADTTYTANFAPASDYVEVTPSNPTASTSDANVPANTVDNNLATRWSAVGDGQWIQFDLGSVRQIGHVNVAVYQGNVRRNRFELQTANAAAGPWTTVFSGESSGTTLNEEPYDFADVSARFIRYLGHGNIGATNPTVNSVTEISIFASSGVATPTPTPTPTSNGPTPTPTLTPTPSPTPTATTGVPTYEEATVTATASTDDGNVAANAIDNNMATRWSGNGDGAWLQLDLGSSRTVGYVTISFFSGNTRASRFDLQVASAAGGPWTDVLTNAMSNGTSTAEETFDFSDISARYVRYLGHGNNSATKPTWNSLQEVSVFVATGVVIPPTPTPTPTPNLPTPTPTPTVNVPTPTPTPTPPLNVELTPGAGGVTASTSDANVPANTVDNNLATRWSAVGDGEWIRFDLGGTRLVAFVNVAVYQGNARRNSFDIQLSSDAANWTTVATAQSSGTTLNEETYDFADTPARYVRYLGHGNTGASNPLVNSVTEVSIFGNDCASCPTPTPTPTPTRTPAPNTVVIQNFAFVPATITISVGQTVTWVNGDSAPHTSTSDTGLWDSGTLAQGASFSRTFTTAGTFDYHCTFHPGMVGTVIVTGGPTPTPTPTTGPFALSSSAFVDNALMPVRFTCAGDGVAGQDPSPPLAWGAGSMNAQAYAIVFADRANGGNKLHWMIWDIKPSQFALPEALGAGFMVPGHSPAKQKAFTSGAATLSFFGPCPGGSTNPYTFTLYAQNVATIPGITSSSTVTQIEAAIKANSNATTAVLRARSNASAN
jgi:plastocyanin/phosphatidylethanolamine-binding protein (PEBP) family uncharacterized protein